MTWTAVRKHYNELLDDFELKLFRDLVPRHLEQFDNGSAAAADQLSLSLIARGPAFVRRELEPLKHILPQSVAAYVQDCVGDYTRSSMLFEYANVTNFFEIVGFEVAPDVLGSFSPVDPARRDSRPGYAGETLDEGPGVSRSGRTPRVGPDRRILPRAGRPVRPTRDVRVQHAGADRSSGGALLSGASLADVLPAWHQFMFVAATLMDVHQIDERVILWVARVVFHHIGKQPLGTVADRVSEEIDRLVAASA